MVKIYIQVTENVFTATPHQWKEIETSIEEKRVGKYYQIQLSDQSSSSNNQISLQFCSVYIITTELFQLTKYRHNDIFFC